MARRIVLAILALICALLGTALTAAIAQIRGDGDQVTVYDRAGKRIAGARSAAAPAAVSGVLSRRAATVRSSGGRLLVIAPVRGDDGGPVLGAVALSRPAGPLNRELTVLWTWLAAVAAGGQLAGAAVAVALARWVARPLSALEAAARQLGDGALATRAGLDGGPGEVRRLAISFNTMAGRLEALVDGHQAMMADVSHQLRTPLAALRLRLDLLAQDADEHTAAEVAGAQEEIARLSRLVDGLLAVARAENAVARPVTIAVHEILSDRAAAWRPAAEERGIEITGTCAGPVRASLADGHLEQILDNLLANALDATPEGRSITVEVGETDGGVEVVVADEGPGMSPAEQARAFDRFWQGPGRKGGSSGLGLAIVRQLARRNGAEVDLEVAAGLRAAVHLTR